MKNKYKTALICVGNGKPQTATQINIDELSYVRNGGHKLKNGKIVHRIEMYFESLNILVVVEDGKAKTYSAVVNENGLWFSDTEDRLFTHEELFKLTYNV